ncbi:MAG: mucoidy inhibitor MuiA family protein, partial [Saprospiraceae bacterium]
MRPLFSLLLLALFFHFLPAQDAPAEVPVKSTIKSATVYLEGAQVNRAATTAVPAGRRTLVFTGLTTDLDPASIQLSSSAADLLVLSVTHRLNFGERPEDGPAQKRLETGIKDLDRQVRRLLTRAAIAKEEEEMLKANRQVAGEQTGLDAADLERAVKFQRERITAIRMGYLAIEDSLRLLAERREDLQVELLELGPPTDQRATAEVVVETETDRALTTDLTLSYLVPNAGWSPRYDLRVADISRPVDLRYQALVYQRSGEDWTDVALTLSTGDPSLSGRVPELPVWRLRPGARPPVYVPVAKAAVDFGYRTVRGTVTDKETGEPLIGASILIIGAAIGTITDLNGTYELNLPAEAESLRVSYTGYDSREFEIVGNQIDVALESGAMLEEVVVIGYGQQGLLGKLKGAVSGINIGGNRSKKSRDQEADAAYAPVPTTVERRATTTAFTIELPYT